MPFNYTAIQVQVLFVNHVLFFWFQTRGVSDCGLAIYIKKYLKENEELLKLKYFTMQKYNLQKIL
jgi:hypothetical protein